MMTDILRMARQFQSTLSVRRATDMVIPPDYVQDISIHALREESDPTAIRSPPTAPNFNPRSP